MIFVKSADLIEGHEGRKNKLYYDTEGVPTAGIGRNLLKPFSDAVIELMFKEDLDEARADCLKYPWFKGLNLPRQAVIENMMFNLGASRFAGFKKTIAYLDIGDFESASVEMLDSKWSVQVGNRSKELSKMMKTGQWL